MVCFMDHSFLGKLISWFERLDDIVDRWFGRVHRRVVLLEHFRFYDSRVYDENSTER